MKVPEKMGGRPCGPEPQDLPGGVMRLGWVLRRGDEAVLLETDGQALQHHLVTKGRVRHPHTCAESIQGRSQMNPGPDVWLSGNITDYPFIVIAFFGQDNCKAGTSHTLRSRVPHHPSLIAQKTPTWSDLPAYPYPIWMTPWYTLKKGPSM